MFGGCLCSPGADLLVVICMCVGSGEDKAKLMFNMYDLDNSGFLTKNEFKMMLR